MALELLSPRNILGMFAKSLEEVTEAPWVAPISWLNDESDDFQEIYRFIDQNPSFRKWVGGRQAHQLGVHSILVLNDEFEVTLDFHRREMRKDKTGQIQMRIDAAVAASAGRHWQQLLTPLLYNGAASAATYGAAATYDGVNFFGNTHRGSQDNRLTVSGFSARVTVAQALEGVQRAIELLTGFTDEHGEPANEGLSGITVVAPPNVFPQVASALDQEFIQGTGGPIQNTLRSYSRALGLETAVFGNARLLPIDTWGTGATRKMVVCRSDNPIKPFIRQQALAPTTGALVDGSDHAFKNNSHQYGVNCERGVGFGLWEHAIQVTFAA